MQRVVWNVARVVVIVAVGFGWSGCDDPTTGVVPPGKSMSGHGAETSSRLTMPADVWSIVQQRCVWCHTTQHSTANLDFTHRTQSAGDVRRIGTGVQVEMAPLVARLDAREKDAILSWVERETGALPPVSIPPRLHWELSPLLAGLPEGAHAPGFGFVLEDGSIDSAPWTVTTYTDRFGISARSIALDQTHAVDPAVFPASRNPSSYFVFAGVPWHGRFHDMRLEGDVRVDRWMSVGMQAERIEPPGRNSREYVRLQFDRDAISLRSAPTAFETWPWGGTAVSPGADGKLVGTTDRGGGFYQRSDEWLHFVLTATRSASGVRWDALVTRRGDGSMVAWLQATQASAKPLGGTFFLHAYAVGGRRNWANLVFDASIDRDTAPTLPPAARRAERRDRPGAR
jgi:hypothetical protein